MQINLKNLLPNDTRTAEIISAIALIASAIILSSDPTYFKLYSWYIKPPREIISLVLLILGATHLISILAADSLHYVRTINCWLTGSFWVWLSVSAIGSRVGGTYIETSDVLSFALGLSNFYAFIILISTNKIWK